MVIKRNTVSLAGLVSVVLVGASFAFTDATYAATYSTSISTSGSVILDVGMNGNGANIATDNVKVVSTCPAGYTVGIAATSATNASFNDTTLYKDGNTANNASSQKILTSTGTKDTPVSILNDNKKTWGYSIANNTTIHSDFIGLTATQAVLTASATGTTATGIDLPVYYGASVDDAIEPGEYKMSDDAVITYYLTANLDCTSYQVVFNPTSIFEGNTITGTGTMNNQRISEGVATPLDTNGFTAPSGYYFAGWNTAQDGTGTSYTDGQSVTDLTTVGNTITLYAQWTDCPGGKICYKENGTNVEGTMGQQTVSDTVTSIDLLASNFSRTGYGFAGWNTKADYTGTFYGPQEEISFIAGQYGAGGLKLYAIWVASAGSMQDVSTVSRVCRSLTTASIDGTANLSSVSALTDQRDNNTYAIAKLADGKCWMIENLRLDNTAEHNTDGSLAQGYDTNATYGNFSGLADPESPVPRSTVANSLYYSGSQEGTASIDIGTSDSPSQRFPRYNNTNTQARASYPTTNSDSMYSYGNYYTWAAAIASIARKGSTYMNTSVTDISICPAGWRLPKARHNGGYINADFWKLGVAIMGASPQDGDAYRDSEVNPAGKNAVLAFRDFPNNFLYYSNRYGAYWSSTPNTDSVAYRMDLNLSQKIVHPGTSGSTKYIDWTIRCLVNS